MRFGNWIIPLMSNCSNCPHISQGGHWTLLHYSVRANQWTFYNPDVPVTGQDHHFIASGLLVSIQIYLNLLISLFSVLVLKDVSKHASLIQVDYLEELKLHCDMVGMPMRTRPSVRRRYLDSPRQPEGSADSGPVTCYVIERLMSQEEIEEDWSADVAGKFRARMVELFYQAIKKVLAN